mgnify:CR=1 FL=1
MYPAGSTPHHSPPLQLSTAQHSTASTAFTASSTASLSVSSCSTSTASAATSLFSWFSRASSVCSALVLHGGAHGRGERRGQKGVERRAQQVLRRLQRTVQPCLSLPYNVGFALAPLPLSLRLCLPLTLPPARGTGPAQRPPPAAPSQPHQGLPRSAPHGAVVVGWGGVGVVGGVGV